MGHYKDGVVCQFCTGAGAQCLSSCNWYRRIGMRGQEKSSVLARECKQSFTDADDALSNTAQPPRSTRNVDKDRSDNVSHNKDIVVCQFCSGAGAHGFSSCNWRRGTGLRGRTIANILHRKCVCKKTQQLPQPAVLAVRRTRGLGSSTPRSRNLAPKPI